MAVKKTKHHMTPKDITTAKALLADGWSIANICQKLKVTRYVYNQTMKGEELRTESRNLADKIRLELEETGTFGKKCEETDNHILQLLRKGIPEILIGHLLGLFYDAAGDEFCEYDDSSKNKERKQAKAEHSVSELLKYGDVMDAKEAIQYLKVLEQVKEQFNSSEDTNTVKVIFTNFDRDSLIPENNDKTKVDMTGMLKH